MNQRQNNHEEEEQQKERNNLDKEAQSEPVARQKQKEEETEGKTDEIEKHTVIVEGRHRHLTVIMRNRIKTELDKRNVTHRTVETTEHGPNQL